jgi:phosphate-selective porin
VNWYLNPNLRMMWNYVWADPSYAGDVGIFQWRFQIAF